MIDPSLRVASRLTQCIARRRENLGLYIDASSPLPFGLISLSPSLSFFHLYYRCPLYSVTPCLLTSCSTQFKLQASIHAKGVKTGSRVTGIEARSTRGKCLKRSLPLHHLVQPIPLPSLSSPSTLHYPISTPNGGLLTTGSKENHAYRIDGMDHLNIYSSLFISCLIIRSLIISSLPTSRSPRQNGHPSTLSFVQPINTPYRIQQGEFRSYHFISRQKQIIWWPSTYRSTNRQTSNGRDRPT